MHVVSSFLLIARCALLLSLLILSRLVAPRLTDNALSEFDYATEESEDEWAAKKLPALYAALPPGKAHSFENQP